MQPLQIYIGPIIRIGRESWCLRYADFFLLLFLFETFQQLFLLLPGNTIKQT